MGKSNAMQLNKITMGVCYYPEHWDESLWASDLQRMLNVGIEVVRIAEFAWNKFEPEEGVYTFEFFDRFMTFVEKTPMKIIFCTPTATPPAWATHNYPEILNANKEGVLFRHGHRRHYNYNSPKYWQLTRDIVTKIGEHYGNHPAIIGWQLDNEFNCEIDEFYSESDAHQFRIFLRNKYGSLDNLNRAWGTKFWNQDYTAWEQVFLPRPTVSGKTNPHQALDYLRFVSDSCIRYADMQSEILRQYINDNVFITTNGLFGSLDYSRLTRECLDFITYDSYPNFAFGMESDPKDSTDLNDRKWSRNLSEARAISPIFGVMEQQSGANGWDFRMETPSPKPGQISLWTMQSVSHGADFICYFRWRTCTVGTEIYWHGILDYDNRDNRRLEEITDTSKKFLAILEVAGAHYKAAFAVVKEYDNNWDTQYDAWHRRVDSVSQAGWFQAAQLTHTPMDYLYINEATNAEDLARYPVLVYPHATILIDYTANLLKKYVEDGGILIMGCRTGYKNSNGHCVMMPKPGLASEICGAVVIDYTLLGPGDDNQYASWDNELIEAAVFNDILEPMDGAEVLATFSSNYYAGQPALVKKSLGKGSAYYFGGAFTQQTAEIFLRNLNIANPYAKTVTIPVGCELTVREKDGINYLFVLNYLAEDAEIKLHCEVYDLYDKAKKSGVVIIEKYGTRVYKL